LISIWSHFLRWSSAASPVEAYVAVHQDHRGHGLSQRLVGALMENVGKPLFATTSSERMKATLMKAGFAQQGKEWKGRRGDQISLWMRQ
jgi:GNAT superfamily N-acetyltransferase